ncbi:hypothetical protein RJT34_10056 [Clitoria ternatea]|uniref:Uncharacterized protein n=1 Tax=Clitoria ternatea TaxID=43366 RepID=A0AAN9K8Y2_CLITE
MKSDFYDPSFMDRYVLIKYIRNQRISDQTLGYSTADLIIITAYSIIDIVDYNQSQKSEVYVSQSQKDKDT